ncbi:MAG: ornithine cyclodeaminase family protein [Betaproteobacteria bacterium]|nr:ornithine cyclodeaminase family protein [Betaproteobacteria bacterium]
MAVMLGFNALRGVLGMREAIDLLEGVLAHEAAGRTVVSPKFNTDFGTGSLRMLFAADHAAGYAATKAYHSIQGVGVRYVISLYRLADGELLALLDGRLITDLRTGAASGVIARKVPLAGPVAVGVIGSGNQARTQLESLAAVYRVESAAVYSPTAAKRQAYAREMSAQLGITVTAVDSAEAAARGREVVATASSSRSSEPVLRGEWLDRCRLLCAVGNTRPQFAEVDVRCFRDARLVVVDSPHAIEEAGELRQAVAGGVLPEAKRATLSQIVSGAIAVPRAGLTVFKSVGTALQDLALAARCFELLGARSGLPAAPDLASLRESAGAGGGTRS